MSTYVREAISNLPNIITALCQTKTCSKCRATLPLDRFYHNRFRSYGRDYYCSVKLALQKAVPELFRSDNLESLAANMQALESMTLHDAVMLGKTGPKAKAKGAA